MPVWLVALAAVFCLVAPAVFTDPAFDHPLLDWLGLGSRDPRTNDYVPILPWFGPVLFGLAAGRTILRRPRTLALARWRAASPVTRALAWAGRKSLPIYLIHQPVLLAVLTGVLQIAGPHPQAQAQAFLAQCTAECLQTNGNAVLCRTTCACMADRLQEGGRFQRRSAPADQSYISTLAQACLRGEPP
jgi:uncharacterized membrane protein